jgi:hypothetical protein
MSVFYLRAFKVKDAFEIQSDTGEVILKKQATLEDAVDSLKNMGVTAKFGPVRGDNFNMQYIEARCFASLPILAEGEVTIIE